MNPRKNRQPGKARATAEPALTPIAIPNSWMQSAYTRGEVTPLSPIITEFVQYLGHWWTLDGPGWLRITDPTFAQFLDAQKEKLAKAINLG